METNQEPAEDGGPSLGVYPRAVIAWLLASVTTALGFGIPEMTSRSLANFALFLCFALPMTALVGLAAFQASRWFSSESREEANDLDDMARSFIVSMATLVAANLILFVFLPK